MVLFLKSNVKVEAYTASWIEISRFPGHFVNPVSRLIQPRGLKYNRGAGRPGHRRSRLIQPRGLKLAVSGTV